MAFNLRTILIIVAVVGTFCFLPSNTDAQRRDYMTEAEIELVRDAQDIDFRIEVLTKAIDRRFAVLKTEVAAPKAAAKESDKWGPLPAGSKLELLDDIKKLLQKAIDDIDNVAAHPPDPEIQAKSEKSEKQAKKDALRFPNAVRALGSAAQRYLPALKSLLDLSKDEKEKGTILDSVDFCDQIIEAQKKLSTDAAAKTKN